MKPQKSLPYKNKAQDGNRQILLRYNEIALKGDNRGWFEDRLAINTRKILRRSLGKEARIEVNRKHGRILVEAPWSPLSKKVLERVFGLSSFSPMRKVPTNLEALAKGALEEAESHFVHIGHTPHSFRVLTRRTDKALSQSSMEIDRYVGSVLGEHFKFMIVDLENPEFILGIEIRLGHSFIWAEKFQALGGLPVGTNARVLALLSGGIDSPVAAIQALKRGTPVSFIHFHGTPFVGMEAITKVNDLVSQINQFQPDPEPLFVVPFGKIQEKIALAASPKTRTLLYRRMMIRIACRVAEKRGARALITGESLGQVASQTVENLNVINSVSTLPILRPLITYDKVEIIQQAQHWGTYATSIQPIVDSCTLFADRHPVIRATDEMIREQEAKFSVEELLKEALEGTSRVGLFSSKN